MQAIIETGLIDAAGIADAQESAAYEAAKAAPGATVVPTLEELLQLDLDGVVIATPSALHAGQVVRALEAGMSVFCQKPLGRNAGEVAEAVAAAQRADRLLAVDFSYRFTEGMQRIKECIAAGTLGDVYAVDLAFHNAYGPDKPWFYDIAQSGGGCVIDLGTHLVDLALWALDFPEVVSVSSALFAKGRRLGLNQPQVEDFAAATLSFRNGAVAQLACSWGLPAGCDAVISMTVLGTKAGAAINNVAGSFYDLSADLLQGTQRTVLARPPDPWGGRAAANWTARLATGGAYDDSAGEIAAVAGIIDRIYGRG
jgi:predicted dehydrogenase